MGTFSVWHWLIVLIVVVLLFGTKKLRNLGGDLGAAVKGFKKGMKEEGDSNADSAALDAPDQDAADASNIKSESEKQKQS